MQQISSVNNKTIKDLAKLNKKKYREDTGMYIIEGFHLIEEALKDKGFNIHLKAAEKLVKETYEKYRK